MFRYVWLYLFHSPIRYTLAKETLPPPRSQRNEQDKKGAPQGEFSEPLSQGDPLWLPSRSSGSVRTYHIARYCVRSSSAFARYCGAEVRVEDVQVSELVAVDVGVG